ncbi:hypothetical protein [Inhella gelatinilytica]|uniref:Secreted protein n=1 Tax=Inhella gelatinilytica TaxID=2795030 RepID=A0A931NB33_9BURK|nr:hypothetical protein [Inhella gelatinilytica]MBH9553143.1 hypothetical protein [Inhella gelatinilytica]
MKRLSKLRGWLLACALAAALPMPSMGQTSSSSSGSSGKSRPIDISAMHRAMNNMVAVSNKKLAGTRVDEVTTLRMVTYDEGKPTLAYFYFVDFFVNTGRKTMTKAERDNVKNFNVASTCGGKFRPFMTEFGLEVAHHFQDASTGIHLIEIRVKRDDCNA